LLIQLAGGIIEQAKQLFLGKYEKVSLSGNLKYVLRFVVLSVNHPPKAMK
jgi:hypothetical protein